MSLKIVKRKGSPHLLITGTVRGVRVRESAGTANRAQAAVLAAKRETELFEESVLGKRGAAVSFQRAAVSWIDFEARSKRDQAYALRLIEHFGVTLARSIGQAEADAAALAIVGRDAAPATKRRAVYDPLTAILNHAAARGWCERPKLQRPSLPKGKTRWLTPAEALRLIDAAAPHLKSLLHFILCTGARLSEALYLDWADVDLAAAKAVFRDTKNGTDRPAALPEAAVLTLANLPIMGRSQGGFRGDDVTADGATIAGCSAKGATEPGEAGGGGSIPPRSTNARAGRVFRTDDGSPYADTEKQYGGQIKTAFKGACRRAGIAELRVHDLRHSWATWFYALGKDLLLLKHEGGWKSMDMVERYAHLAPSDIVGEIARVWGASHPRIGQLPGVTIATEKARTA